jgi:hypothetical protein
MDLQTKILIVCLVISALCGCSAIAGYLALHKRRSPYEGLLLGFLLGPIGVMIVSRRPFVHRPIVDVKAWNSLRSMVTYQESGKESKRGRLRESELA